MSRGIAPALALAAFSPIPALASGWQAASGGGVSAEVHVPDVDSPVGSGKALLVVLHGCTQTAATLKQHGAFETASNDLGVVVALPSVPNGGVYAGCWDYYGADHARTGRHDGPLLDLTASLVADASLGIDPDQVYVAGLSSGAGEAMVLGCVAPDVFAGVGLAAGPTVGTDASEIAFVSTVLPIASDLCRSLAGAAASDFETQLVSVIQGDGDYIVAQGYGELNAAVFASIYGAGSDLDESSFAVGELDGFMPAGQGSLWSDAAGPRVSRIVAAGTGHAWPAGSGAGTEVSFVAKEGVDYARYLADFFSKSSRRAAGGASSSGASGGGGGQGAPGGAGAAEGSSDTGEGCSVGRRPGRSPVLEVTALFALLIGRRRRGLLRASCRG